VTASLDDLLRHEESAPRRPVLPLGWLAARISVQAALLAAVVYVGLRIGGYSMAPLLLFAVFAGLLVVRWAARVLSEPDGQVVRELVVRQAGARDNTPAWYAGQDGMIYALRRWETRLSWSATSSDRFAHTLPRYLGELVDERLRQRHGLTRGSDPVKARQICGERLWTFLHEPATYQPSQATLAAMIDEMERL
jgi:hypothetical protein